MGPLGSVCDSKAEGYFYQSWYFYLAVLLLAIPVASQFFSQRVKLVKGQIGVVIEERNRIARECHDTLMAGFAAISWQLEATAKIFRDGALADTSAAKSLNSPAAWSLIVRRRHGASSGIFAIPEI